MMENALIFSVGKSGMDNKDQVVSARGNGDCITCDYLRFGLANEVAGYLGSIDETIKSIYVYDPESATNMNGRLHNRPEMVPGINMIVRVSRKTAALESLLTSVVSAVEGEFGKFTCPDANALCNTIDVIVVNDKEIAQRTGYGALVDSLFTPPIEIWHR
jgi:hypothetical protein